MQTNRSQRAGRIDAFATFGVAVVVLVGSLPSILRDLSSPNRPKSTSSETSARSSEALDTSSGRAEAADGSTLSGVVEAIPQNVYHAAPYNDWPLFEIKVHEGQRLKFRREKGTWIGDSPSLFVQFETPAEIDVKSEEVELATRETQVAEASLEILRIELQKEVEAATVREENARQQYERSQRLSEQKAATKEDLQRSRNAMEIAVIQKQQATSLLAKKMERAKVQTELAEHRLRRSRNELELTNFKRELSWGNVPVANGQFEEVVVTKVRGIRGDVPSASRREAWVEVIDDRVLNVRVFLTSAQATQLAAGQRVKVLQEKRTYEGKIRSVGIVADEKTLLIPMIAEVKNSDRQLKINTAVNIAKAFQ